MANTNPTRRNLRHGTGTFGRWAVLNSLGSVIYALRMDDGTIKIGFTTDLADRERTVRRQGKSASSELLAFMVGAKVEDEQAIHADLVDHLAHGHEWYHPTPEVLAVVNGMRDAFNLPHIAA